MIYFIQSENGGPIKIGTTRSVSSRIVTLRSERGDPHLQVLAVQDGGHREERLLHQRFDHLALGHEWFHPAPDLLDYIRVEAKAWAGEPNESAKVALDVLKMARVITAARGDSVSNLLSDTCRPVFQRILKQLQEGAELVPPQEGDY